MSCPPPSYFIGWDVGGWNCDKNPASRDAIVILGPDLGIAGTPWRGNLRRHINDAEATSEWLKNLFRLCALPQAGEGSRVTLAIDTPLGFSQAFLHLVTDLKCAACVDSSDTNPYLFRETERFLFTKGLSPLSAVKDMIGSQATKGMHVLARFAPNPKSCGVWSDGFTFTAIEAYPSACRRSGLLQGLRSQYGPLGHEDKEDALTCAMVAYLFAERRGELVAPPASVPMGEGWIWVPRDAVERNQAI